MALSVEARWRPLSLPGLRPRPPAASLRPAARERPRRLVPKGGLVVKRHFLRRDNFLPFSPPPGLPSSGFPHVPSPRHAQPSSPSRSTCTGGGSEERSPGTRGGWNPDAAPRRTCARSRSLRISGRAPRFQQTRTATARAAAIRCGPRRPPAATAVLAAQPLLLRKRLHRSPLLGWPSGVLTAVLEHEGQTVPAEGCPSQNGPALPPVLGGLSYRPDASQLHRPWPRASARPALSVLRGLLFVMENGHKPGATSTHLAGVVHVNGPEQDLVCTRRCRELLLS